MHAHDLRFDSDFVAHVIGSAREAALFIESNYKTLSESDIESKGINSLVSYVDKHSEVLLVKALSQISKEYGFITEEETTTTSRKRYNWIIDPLDGTTNFIHKIPFFSISIALEKDGIIQLGIVYDIMHDEMYCAVKGEGAMCNRERLHIHHKPGSLSDSVIATGFPYDNKNIYNGHIHVLSHIIHNARALRRLGSAALDLCYVAAGRFGGFYEMALNPWDIAAGGLIVQEAGGHVSDFSGNNDWLSRGEVLAATPIVHQELLALTSDFYN